MKGEPSPNQSLYVRLFSQDVICFQRFELLRAMLHRYVIGYLLLVLVAITALNLRGAFQPISVAQSVVAHAAGMFVTMVVPLGLVTWLEWRHDGESGLVLSATPILVLGCLLGVLTGELMIQVGLGMPAPSLGQLFLLWLFFYFLAEVVFALVMYLVMPKVLSDMRGVQIRSITESHRFTADSPVSVPAPEPAPGAGALPKASEIGGQRIALSDLHHIEAEGNYIRVTTARKRLYLPGPFSPVAESLPPELGIQVSRSDWVARAAVAAVLCDGAGVRLRLVSGAEVQVPKNRQKAVLAWMAEGAPVPGSARTGGNVNPDRAMM